MVSAVPNPGSRRVGSFQHVVEAFLAGDDGLPFSFILSAERIKRVADERWLWKGMHADELLSRGLASDLHPSIAIGVDWRCGPQCTLWVASAHKRAIRRTSKTLMEDKFMGLKKILFATDYSEASKEALRVASSLAKDSGATLLICNVSELEPYPVGEPAPADAPSDSTALKELKTVVPTDSTVPYEHHLLFGEPGSAEITKPAEVIVKFANEKGADMIVLGTHGRTGVGHLLMGSVAEHVIRHAVCPVTTIKVAR